MKWRHKLLQKSLLTPEPMKYFLTLLHRVTISIKIAYLILSDKHLHGNVMIIHWNHLLSWLSTQGLPKTEVSSLLCLFIYFYLFNFCLRQCNIGWNGFKVNTQDKNDPEFLISFFHLSSVGIQGIKPPHRLLLLGFFSIFSLNPTGHRGTHL